MPQGVRVVDGRVLEKVDKPFMYGSAGQAAATAHIDRLGCTLSRLCILNPLRQVTQVAVAISPMTVISLLLQDSPLLFSLSPQFGRTRLHPRSLPGAHSDVRCSVRSAFWQGKVPENVHSHRWTVYLRALEHEDLSYFIEHVTFHLHPTIPNPVRGQSRELS